MARSVMRRTVSKVLVGAMAVAALGAGQVAFGSGAASAAPVSETVTTSNIKATKTIDNPNPFPGDTVTSTVVIELDGGVDRYLRDYTDYPPAGYQLLEAKANVWRGGPLIGNWNNPAQYDGPGTQDPVSGAVKLWWTDHGTAMGAAGRMAVINKGATLTFKYKVPSTAQPGPRETGMSFNVETFGSTQTWNPLTGLNLSVQRPPTATNTTVTVPPSAKTGQPVQLSASVTPGDATGTVQFMDGSTPIGAPVQVVNGAASLPYTFTAAGPHAITAAFFGSGGFINSSSPGAIVDVSVPTPDDVNSATIMTAPQTATVGTSVRLSAQISANGAQLPGTVQFYDAGNPIGPRIAVGNGAVAIDHTFTVAGPHQISVAYTGGQGVNGSASLPQTIQVADAPTQPGGTGSLGSLGGGFGSLGG
ncbi:Ig-like domain repeat protein [Prescottella agglutinans]|uniref:Ig-like domain repeat protein n=1 Tax=Prescottella agglutinans TaxID=1644129 RepID=A0A3S3CVV6_9NOCA|nr:Ig-like domain-containing protein [Prescottella agglutinans]RVW06923.1 Ig-like domain repeat protein [Prescottella agglutinans]